MSRAQAELALSGGGHHKPLQQLKQNSNEESYDENDEYEEEEEDDDHEEHESLGLVHSRTSNDSLNHQAQQRWKRLPVTEDDYLEDADELNSDLNLEPTEISRRVRILGAAVVLIAVLALLIPARSNKRDQVDSSELYTTKKIKGTPQYTCPIINENATVLETSATMTTTSTNYDPFVTKKEEELAVYVLNDLDSYIESFHDIQYDQWDGKTFNEIKEDLREWKKSKFLLNLKTGASIYESGASIGLNLLLTLEIAQEEKDSHYITDLHLYGNDNVVKAAQVANLLLDRITSKVGSGAKRGVICAAESTKLREIVPADSFDLVYSQSIPSLPDPLTLNLQNNNTESNKQHMHDLCSVENRNDWEAQTLLELAQDKQNSWYNSWVIEMIRIAKPGAPIIIEYVSPAYCEVGASNNTKTDGRVGVSKDFWNNSIIDYDWNVNPDSLEIASGVSSLFPSRYHVFMRKNGP